MLSPTELTEWFNLTEELPAKVAREKELRAKIFADVFTAPVIGTNRHNLGHGKDLKAVYKMSFGIDRPALAEVGPTIPAELLHSVVKYDPKVSEGSWNKLTDAERNKFGNIVTIKPALPVMEIVNVKTRG